MQVILFNTYQIEQEYQICYEENGDNLEYVLVKILQACLENDIRVREIHGSEFQISGYLYTDNPNWSDHF